MAQLAADLHIHTTASDGKLTVEELPAAADAANVDLVAITDHDRIHPALTAPVTNHEGLTVIRGIELRVETDRQQLDLLGYGVEPTTALASELDRLQRDRIERAEAIIDCIETRLGVDLTLDPQPGIGRPHIARAIADSDTHHDYQTAFDALIGDGDPCYVSREVTPFNRGLDLLTDACPVVSLAHPFRYDDPEAALDHAPEFDAIERYYPYDHTVDTKIVDTAIDRHNLLATGGSDAHGMILGQAGPPAAATTAFRQRVEKR